MTYHDVRQLQPGDELHCLTNTGSTVEFIVDDVYLASCILYIDITITYVENTNVWQVGDRIQVHAKSTMMRNAILVAGSSHDKIQAEGSLVQLEKLLHGKGLIDDIL